MMVDEGYILNWNRGKTSVMASLDPMTNLPTVSTAGTYKTFNAFAAKFKSFPTVIPDDEDEIY